MLVQRIVMSAMLLTFAGSDVAVAREGKKGGGGRKESRGVTQKRERKATSAPKTDGTEGKAGRYQLLPAEYGVNDLINETITTKKDLVLLDTATGQMKVCTQKSWLNVADGKEISERKCTPFETYGEYPVGTMKGRKSREGELSRP